MDDLECMACPPKYRHIATFHKYYSGQVQAPYPTLFSEQRQRGGLVSMLQSLRKQEGRASTRSSLCWL